MAKNRSTGILPYVAACFVFAACLCSVAFIYSELRITGETSQTTIDSRSSDSNGAQNNPLRIAFCVTGQLARLELHSKIKNVILANADAGHVAHTFLYLDNEINNVRQTYWKFNYSSSLYGHYSEQNLKSYIDKSIDQKHENNVRTWVRLEPPPRFHFDVFWNESVPVTEKKFTGHDGSKDNYESAENRFQNNMRWMAGLRECTKWVQEIELEQGMFYDIIVRLRDDSFALGPWTFDSKIYLNSLVSLDLGNSRGINDHNFAIDRKWSDDFFRGLSEDYYFNHTKIEKWLNPEQHLLQVAERYGIQTKSVNICDMPLVPLRGLINETYWRVHPLYMRYLRDTCPYLSARKRRKNNKSRKSRILTMKKKTKEIVKYITKKKKIKSNKSNNSTDTSKNKDKSNDDKNDEKDDGVNKIEKTEDEKKEEEKEKKREKELKKKQREKEERKKAIEEQLEEEQEEEKVKMSCCPADWETLIHSHAVKVNV
jgi:hypothetical protein